MATATSENPIVPAKELEAARRDMGELVFAQGHLAQFVTAGAGMFKPEWFEQRYEPYGADHYRLPDATTVHRDALERFVIVDLAASTKTTADYTVILVVGRLRDGRHLVLDVDRARREGPDIVPAIQRVVDRWRIGVVWIERVAFQLAIVQQARRAGLPVRELAPTRDKIARALPATAAFEGGRLLLPKAASWLRDLENELLSFPLSPHDDMVDCIGYAVAAATQGYKSPVFGGADLPSSTPAPGVLGNLVQHGHREAMMDSIRIGGPRRANPWPGTTPMPGTDARMLLYVVRARFRHGTPPWEHADALAAVAQDERLRIRTQRVAAELLAKLRMAGPVRRS